MAAIRVANIVTQMEGGGAQAVAMGLSQGLRDRGYDTQTWFLYRKRPTYDHHEHVACLLEEPVRGAGDYLRLLGRLTRRLRQWRPQVVISHTHYANVLAQAVARACRVPLRLAVQHSPSSSYPRRVRQADRLLGGAGFYHANVMISQTVAHSFDAYPAGYRRHAVLIANGLMFRRSTADPAQARAKWNLPAQAPLVICTGRLSAEKNHAVLLRALVDLPEAHLAIAGAGELRAELDQLARSLAVADRVHLLGEVAPRDMPDFLCTGDCYAQPSRFEGLSIALLEAMAAGLPILVSDIASQADVLRMSDGMSAGLLLPADDPRAWASTLADLLPDTGARHRLARLAMRRAADFSPEKMIDGYEAVIRRGLAGPLPAARPSVNQPGVS